LSRISRSGEAVAKASATGTLTQMGFRGPGRSSSRPEPSPARVREIRRPSSDGSHDASMRIPRQKSSISSSTGENIDPTLQASSRVWHDPDHPGKSITSLDAFESFAALPCLTERAHGAHNEQTDEIGANDAAG
jgi:hypothetical protein